MHNNQFPFIGRHEAFDVFHSLPSARAQKNVLYVQASGGLGKTRLLREYIQSCHLKPRWHVRPPDSEIDPLIDFFELRNRSVSGLRRSIIERLGWDYFTEFHAIENELRSEEAKLTTEGTNGDNEHLAKVVALRRRRDGLFFRNLRPALRGRQVVLFFDTFELVSHRQVGRWLLREFLPQSEACLIVIAGRPPCPDLHPNIQFIELEPFTEDETMEYFRKRNWLDVSAAEVSDLRSSAEGSPLLLDMLMDFRNTGLLELSGLRTASKQTTEQALVDRLIRVLKPEHTAIVEMAYLKRRYDPRIFAHRQQGQYPAYEDINDFDDLCAKLLGSELRSIMKYRQESQVLSLHDEVQRMIETHAPRLDRELWDGLCQELYQEIVNGWYLAAVEDAKSDEERYLLRAERLGYELEHDLEKGLTIYERYFDQIRKDHLFDFNELAWGEVLEGIRQRADPNRAYQLCYAQADWLWFVNQFDAAADLYHMIIEEYTSDPRHAIRRLEALASLGHASMRVGQFEQATIAFEEGYSLARKVDNRIWTSAFQQNIGQLMQQLDLWMDAEHWLLQAVETAETAHHREAIAIARVNLGRIQAFLGKYNESILNCEMALALRQDVLLHPEVDNLATQELSGLYFEPVMAQPEGYFSQQGAKTRVGIAHVWLAQAYRYSGLQNRAKARQHYDNALNYLSTTSEFMHLSEAWQGLANTYYDEGNGFLQSGDCAKAIPLFLEAFELLSRAVTLDREKRLVLHLPKGLHRLAHVVYAVAKLDKLDSLCADERLRVLSSKVHEFQLPEEENWLYQTRHLREHEPFHTLDMFAKAQRMFEVSSLEAERFQDYNTSLDSLIQAGEIALYRGRPADVVAYARLASVPTRKYQQDLFVALTELLLADLDISEGRISEALERYADSFLLVVDCGGHGRYLLIDRLDRLGNQLNEMPVHQAIEWCDTLIQAWTAKGLHNRYPEMLARMWEYRNQLVEHKAARMSNQSKLGVFKMA